jgi:hypothetical protein
MDVSNSILHTRPLRVAVGYLTIANTGPMSDWSARSGWSLLARIVSSWYRGVSPPAHPLGPTSGETHLSDSTFPTIALNAGAQGRFDLFHSQEPAHTRHRHASRRSGSHPTAAQTHFTGPSPSLYDHLSPCVDVHSGTSLVLLPGN